MNDSIAKFASQAQAKVQTKPQATPQTTAEGQAVKDRQQRWENFVLHSAQYPVKKPRILKNGQIKVTFSIPAFQGEVTVTCQPDELPKLAYGHPGFLGASIAWQCTLADQLLHPDPHAPKRESTKNLVKWLASQEAKQVHPTIVYLHNHPEAHFRRYTQLVEAVAQTGTFTKKGPQPGR